MKSLAARRSLLVSFTLAAALTAACATGARPPIEDGGTDVDTWLVTEVTRVLQEERRVSAERIDVGVSEGVVVLSGVVGSADEARRALRLAGRVHGVRQVVNRLRILPSG